MAPDGGERRPRILAITDFFPWPARNGGLLRTSLAVESLSDVGEVDLFSLYDRREPDRVVPPGVKLHRVGAAPYPDIDASGRWRTSWLFSLGRRGVPMEVAMRRADKQPRRALETWLSEDARRAARGREIGPHDPHDYDLVWFSRATIFDWLGRPHLGPTVVDLHDLESDKEGRRAAFIRADGQGAIPQLRARVARAQARINARRWAAFERAVAGESDRALLASGDDVGRTPLPHVGLLPNTFRRPDVPLGVALPSRPPTILFQGTFDYGPNVDGARWLVHDVGPHLRAEAPGSVIRLVGRTTPDVRELDDRPDVVVVGQVPDMDSELARADVAVVPVRYASGTRLKILESFAHRIPVVSTRVGAEGLDVLDGVHLLLADTPAEFARACLRVVDDLELRRRLVDAAEERFLERYEAHVAREQIAALVAELAPASR